MKPIFLNKKPLFSLQITIILLFLSTTVLAQTWQWGKRGGSATELNLAGGFNDREIVRSIATDAQGNVFVISNVGNFLLNVDGVPGTHYAEQQGYSNGMVASFSCNGTYRWSKVIGGRGNTPINDVKTDASGNVYVVGDINSPSPFPELPTSFNGEFTAPTTTDLPGGIIANFFTTYLVKYSNSGNLQWVKFIENTSSLGSVLSSGMNKGRLKKIEIDAQGNLHILAMLASGSFFNGLLTVPSYGTYVLKLNSQGNYISSVRLDMNSTDISWHDNVKFKRNFNTGEFYLTNLFRTSTNSFTMSFGGIPHTKPHYLAKFSPTGAFMWKRENTENSVGPKFTNVFIDTDNSIYYQGSTQFSTLVGNDTFAGVSFPIDPLIPFQIVFYAIPYIIKFSPDGVPLWSSNPRRGQVTRNNITVNGNEVAIGTPVKDITWGDITFNYPPGDEIGAAIVRLNKNTGEFITMDRIPSSAGSQNYPETIIADHLGNYYVGGGFNSTLMPGSSTLINNGGSDDFFIAKYGTSNCNCQLPTCSFRALNTANNLNVFNFRYYGQDVYTSISWNFGDGAPLSSQVNPTHTYSQPGVYNVCLTATNACGTQTFCSTVNTNVLGILDQKLEVANLLTLAPNPANSLCAIDYEISEAGAFITIYDMNGRLMKSHSIKDQSKSSWLVDVSNFAAGVYLVTVQVPNGALIQKKLSVVR